MSWLSKSIVDGPAKIVGSKHVVVMDGECVDAAEDYLPVIREIAAITGVLRFDHIECEEDDAGRLVTLVQAGRTWTGRVQGNTDWIDNEGLLLLLNQVLEELGAAKRLHAIQHPTWGQELGVVFAAEAELAKLRAAEYSIESDEPPPAPDDETLAADRVIHGILFHAGTVVEHWTDPPFDAMAVTLATPHDIRGLTLPAETHLMFREDGTLLCCVTDGKRIPFDNGWRHDLAEDGY